MGERLVLLVGACRVRSSSSPEAASSRPRSVAVVRALADPRHGGGSRDRGDPRGRRQREWYGPAVFRSEDRGATWSDSSEALGYGRCRQGHDRLERYAGARRAVRGRRAGRLVPERRWRDVAPRGGPDEPPHAPSGSAARATCASTRSSPTRTIRTAFGSASRPWVRSRHGTAGAPGRRGTAAYARTSCRHG